MPLLVAIGPLAGQYRERDGDRSAHRHGCVHTGEAQLRGAQRRAPDDGRRAGGVQAGVGRVSSTRSVVKGH
jgi:hypothetical protein